MPNTMSLTDTTVVNSIRHQKTFVILKPDTVLRGLVGAIITRFENRGLKIVATKMLRATEDTLKQHYPVSRQEWVTKLGVKGREAFASIGQDITLDTNYSDQKMGEQVLNSLIQYMQAGPIICLVLEGVQAISVVRQMVGATLPTMAQVGTIRGDYSVDFPVVGLSQGRALHNLVHASETPEEAQYEIELWFTKEEIQTYQIGLENIMVEKFY
jgi:nucleoside-diphosphate kinase